VDVAFEPPALLVLRGDDPLAGRGQLVELHQHLLGEPDVPKDQAGLGREVGGELVLGRRQPFAADLQQRERAKELAAVVHGVRGRRIVEIRIQAVRDRDRPGTRAGGRPGRPGGLAPKLAAHPKPHTRAGRTRPLGQDPRHAGKQVLVRVRAGHARGELGQDLVGCGALPVDQAVGEPLDPRSDRLEGHRHHPGGQDRQPDVWVRTLPHGMADADHDPHVHGGDEPGQRRVHDRLVEDDVDVVEAVFHDRHRGGRGDPDDDGRQAEQEQEDVQGLEVDVQRGGESGQREAQDPDERGVDEPSELFALVAHGPPEPQDQGEERCHASQDERDVAGRPDHLQHALQGRDAQRVRDVLADVVEVARHPSRLHHEPEDGEGAGREDEPDDRTPPGPQRPSVREQQEHQDDRSDNRNRAPLPKRGRHGQGR